MDNLTLNQIAAVSGAVAVAHTRGYLKLDFDAVAGPVLEDDAPALFQVMRPLYPQVEASALVHVAVRMLTEAKRVLSESAGEPLELSPGSVRVHYARRGDGPRFPVGVSYKGPDGKLLAGYLGDAKWHNVFRNEAEIADWLWTMLDSRRSEDLILTSD